METIGRKHPRGRRRGPSAARDLATAYRDLFLGTEQGRIVLADLAEQSGFYTVSTPTETDAQVRFAEGKRFVFGRILRFLRLSEAEIARLEMAAREETLYSQEEGII
jgi:hypothetical protein